jgi:uncharacterized protein YecE (DUF72 family)
MKPRTAKYTATELDTLRAENERLREALETISNELQTWNSSGDPRHASWPARHELNALRSKLRESGKTLMRVSEERNEAVSLLRRVLGWSDVTVTPFGEMSRAQDVADAQAFLRLQDEKGLMS